MTEINKQFETLLHELKDKEIISEWYYNGEYHWKYAESNNWEQCTGCAYDDVSPDKEPCKSCVDNNMYTELKPEKKYRPFKDCEELVKYWDTYYGSICRPKNTMPLVWVKNIVDGCKCLITAYGTSEELGEDYVVIREMQVTMKELYANWTFLDGSRCGVEE